MAEKKLPAKPKTFKFPKSMGACADKFFEIRQRRLEAQKVADAIETEEKALRDHIINNLPKGDTGASGKHHKVQTRVEEIPQVEDWRKFYDYVKKNDAFDLLQRRLNTAAVTEREETLNARTRDPSKRKLIPGTKKFKAVKVSLTKI